MYKHLFIFALLVSSLLAAFMGPEGAYTYAPADEFDVVKSDGTVVVSGIPYVASFMGNNFRSDVFPDRLPIVRVGDPVDTGHEQACCVSGTPPCPLKAYYENETLVGNVGLILRGGCSFMEKAKNCMYSGASACVIYSCSSEDGCLTHAVLMSADDYIDVPTIMTNWDEGNAVVQAREAEGETLYMQLPHTGKIDADNLEGLQAFFANMHIFYDWYCPMGPYRYPLHRQFCVDTEYMFGGCSYCFPFGMQVWNQVRNVMLSWFYLDSIGEETNIAPCYGTREDQTTFVAKCYPEIDDLCEVRDVYDLDPSDDNPLFKMFPIFNDSTRFGGDRFLCGQMCRDFSGVCCQFHLNEWSKHNISCHIFDTNQKLYSYSPVPGTPGSYYINIEYEAPIWSNIFYETCSYMPCAEEFDPCLHRMFGTWCVDGKVRSIWMDDDGGGFIPEEFCKMKDIRSFNHAGIHTDAQYSWDFPCCFGNLDKLWRLGLVGNRGYNTIKSWPKCAFGAGKLKSLRHLDLESQGISFSPPARVFALQSLSWISLNQIGTIVRTPCDFEDVYVNETISTPPYWQIVHYESDCPCSSYNSCPSPFPSISSPMIEAFNMEDISSVSGYPYSTTVLTGKDYIIDNDFIVGAARSSIRYILMTNGRIRGEIHPTAFDNLTKIYAIDLSNNVLSGSLPEMKGSGAQTLEVMSWNNNGFGGKLPTTWSALQKLSKLIVSDNRLESPPTALSHMRAMKYWDGSYNLFTTDTGKPEFNNSAGALLATTQFGCEYMDWSHNYISGTLDGGWWNYPSGQKLIFSHNLMTGLLTPNMWVETSSTMTLRRLDISHNGFDGYIPDASFPISIWPDLAYLDFRSNNLSCTSVCAERPYPSFARASSTYVKDSIIASYSCASVEGSGRSFDFIGIDSKYNGYRYCSCEIGYYGTPPDCMQFEDNFMLNYTSGQFSDGGHEGRIHAGMDVDWVIDPPPPEENEDHYKDIRRLVFKVTLDLFLPGDTMIFYNGPTKIHDKVLTLEAGDHGIPNSQLRTIFGRRMLDASILQDPQDPSKRMLKFTILSNSSIVNFISDHLSGEHFRVEFDALNTCPENLGLFLVKDIETEIYGACAPPEYDLPTYSRNLNLGIPIVFIAIGVVFIGILIWGRQRAAFRAAHVASMIMIMVGCILAFFHTILFAVFEANDTVCYAREITGKIAFIIVFSFLFGKTYRIHRIFNETQLKITRVPVNKILVLPFAVIEIGLLLGEFLTFDYGFIDANADGSMPGIDGAVPWCGGEYYDEWQWGFFAYHNLILFFGSYLTYRVKDVVIPAFNEATHLLLVLYNMTFIYCITTPLLLAVKNDPTAYTLLYCIFLDWGYFWCMTGLMVPKIFWVYNDTDVFSSAVSGTGSAGRPSGQSFDNSQLGAIHKPSQASGIGKLQTASSSSMETASSDQP